MMAMFISMEAAVVEGIRVPSLLLAPVLTKSSGKVHYTQVVSSLALVAEVAMKLSRTMLQAVSLLGVSN